MRQKKVVKSRKKLWIVAGIVAVLVIAFGLVKISGILKSDSPAVKEQTYNNNKKSAAIANGGVPVTGDGKTPANTTYTPPTDNNGITITPRDSGDTVVIGTQLVGYSDGNCSLTVTNGAKTNTQTADVIYAPSYSICAGFTIAKSALGAGTWNISLAVTSGGNTTTKTATYEVAP
ncbi:MAG TPA: hypothetical protein VLF40_02100 [Candidatus Saccharimonadales bacterium]|nr:hypothetical protein [Candidatus Saccharimonadales bacterium]